MTKGEQIREMLLAGKPYSEISSKVGCAKATISYHAKALGLSQGVIKKDIDWLSVQEMIDNGLTVKEICSTVGIAKDTYQKAVKKGKIIPILSKSKYTLDELIESVKGIRTGSYDRYLIKKFLFSEGRNKCEGEGCGIDNWFGERIMLELDHIDGNPRNNTLDNFRLLCPNCHSITDTWRGRNIGR